MNFEDETTDLININQDLVEFKNIVKDIAQNENVLALKIIISI